MSPLSNSIKKRIHELTASIEAHKIELAAYERVLHLELAKEGAAAETEVGAHEVGTATATHQTATGDAPAHGNKTALVAEVIKSSGKTGATPKEIDAVFAARDIGRSKNLIYNILSYLVARKRLQRRDGKYFSVATKGTAKKAVKKAAKKVTKRVTGKTAVKKSVAKVKRQFSPEALKRIRDGVKKRWANKRAAEAAAKQTAKTA